MAWQLTLYTPMGVELSTITEETSPNPVMESLEVIVDAGGRTNQITARVKQELIQATPRSIISVSLDGTPVGAGVIVTCPHLTSPGSGPADRDADALDRITAVGLEQLLRDSIIGPRLFVGDHDVAAIALELCELYAHPALIVDAANFPSTSHFLGIYYSPEKTLYDSLTELCDTLPGGGTFRVSPDLAIHFDANPVEEEP